MSLITYIMGWIEVKEFEGGREYNESILNELRNVIRDEKYDGFLRDMFCIPSDTGSKEPGYIMFGASINHAAFNILLDEFEEFIKKLDWFNAFVFCEENDGENVYTIGYSRTDEGFIKDVIEFGEPVDYDRVCNVSYERDNFPVLFNILKLAISGSHINGKISHKNIYHTVLKYGELLHKSNNVVYEFSKKDFNLMVDGDSIKLVRIEK